MIWEIDERAREIEGLDENGRARPEYAASLGLIRAPFGRRVLATVIEALIVVVIQLPMVLVVLPAILSVALDGEPVSALSQRDDLVWLIVWGAASSFLSTVFILVQLIMLGRKGVTLGKAVTGLRAVNVRTLERPGFWRGAVVRYLVLSASFALPLLGPLLVVVLSPLFDPQRRGRGWPDMAGAIWLVDARRGLHPYDEKRMRIARKTVATDLRDEKAELPSLATPVASAGAGAYIPLARNKGGVLGAVRSTPAGGALLDADAGAGAEAVEPRSTIPTTVAAPSAPVVAPSAAPPAPAAALVPPAAPAATSPAAGTWSPPPLLEDPPPASAAPAQVELTLDSGESVVVTGGGVVLGRSPATGPEDRDVTPVPVADPTRSISKTHWALLCRDGAVFAVERGSTNGSVLLRGSAEQALEPGSPIALRDGDVIRFGDRRAVLSIR